MGDEAKTQSPWERLDAALAKIDTHIDDDEAEAPVAGSSENGG